MRRATWRDAYDTQMGLWRWWRSDAGKAYARHLFRDQTRGLSPGTEHLAASLFSAEEDRLLLADPVFVSGEMCDVIDAAHRGFQPEPLIPSDLLTPVGFVYLERPVEIPDRFDEPCLLRAFSWSPVVALRDAENAILPDETRQQIRALQDAPINIARDDDEGLWHWADDVGLMTARGVGFTIYADDERVGVFPIHLTPWWFGMTFDGNEVDENGQPTGAGWWWRVAQTTLRLMAQRISVRHPTRPARPQRREAARHGWGDRDVLVVRLRRERGEPEHDEGTGDAAYSHRFIVRGHWRDHWYPSAQTHRQIWISPFVKGPQDKPLIVRPRRAFTLTR